MFKTKNMNTPYTLKSPQRLISSQLSTQRQNINTNNTDPDSPSRQRIQILSDKWNQVQSGLEQDKFQKKEVLEDRIQQLEESTLIMKPKDDQKLKIYKDQILSLQDGLNEEQIEINNQIDKQDRNLKSIQDNIVTALEQDRGLKIQNDTKLIKMIDDKLNMIGIANARTSQQHEERVVVPRLQQVRQQLQIIEEQLDSERQSREQSVQTLVDSIQEEISIFQDKLHVEKRIKDETQNKIFGMIEDMHNNLQYEIQSEKREREYTTNALLKLLEDACLKIDQNFS